MQLFVLVVALIFLIMVCCAQTSQQKLAIMLRQLQGGGKDGRSRFLFAKPPLFFVEPAFFIALTFFLDELSVINHLP